MNLQAVKAMTIGTKQVKQVSLDSEVIWQLSSGILIPFVTGSWTSYGMNVSVDDNGIITLDGAPEVSNALFIRLTNSYLAAISSTGMADSSITFIPAGIGIRFSIERISGDYSHVSNSFNVVLRDTRNVVGFNCTLGDGVWSQEGTWETGISCLSLYIRRAVSCTELRIRPRIELL